MASPQLVQPPQQQQQQQPQPQQQPFQPYRSPGSVLLYESNSDVSYIIAEHGCLCCLTPAAEFVVGTSKVQVFTDYVYSVSSWDKTEFLKAWMRAAGPQIEETMSNVRTIQFDSVKREDILAVRSADSNASYVVAKQDSMCSDCLLCLCSLGLSLCVHMCNKPPVLIKQTGYKVPLTLTLRTKVHCSSSVQIRAKKKIFFFLCIRINQSTLSSSSTRPRPCAASSSQATTSPSWPPCRWASRAWPTTPTRACLFDAKNTVIYSLFSTLYSD